MLGPVELYVRGRVWQVGPRQRRQTLAALAVDAGRAVSVQTLIDRVWDEAPPGARRALHAHITRIRRLLEKASAGAKPPARLERRSGGYMLEIDAGQIDLHRFGALVRTARTPARTDVSPVELLAEARSLWRGEPLTDLSGRWAEHCRQAWRQQYLDATVLWAEAAIQTHTPGEVLGPLSTLSAQYPLNESLAMVMMRSLNAAGRPAEALKQYHAVRERLAKELGTDPSAPLQALYQAILHGHVETSPTAPATRITDAVHVVPAQLPADVFGFTGRRKPIGWLNSLLETADPGGPALTAVKIATISGTAGVGKTALAVHWAHTVAQRFPDGQMYVNLRGFDPAGQTMAPAEAIRGFLDALGVAPERVPASLDAQASLFRSLLAGRRILLMLDNARDADHVRCLLPGTPTALVVVTSRDQLTSLVAATAAKSLVLDVLSDDEAHDLLTYRLGERPAAESAAVEKIITKCARLPLALAIAAARAQHTGFPLSVIAAELNDSDQQLDALDAGDPASQIRTVFSWSVAALSPPAARLFSLLGLHPGPDISVAAATSLDGQRRPDTRGALNELHRASLLTEHAPGRYTFHDLLRAYASDLAQTTGSHTTNAATTRMLGHYTHTAHTCARLLEPARDEIMLPLTPLTAGVRPEKCIDAQQAMAWLTAEHSVLLAAQRHAYDNGFDTQAWQIAWALSVFLNRQGRRHDHLVAWQVGLAAADRLRRPVAQADAHRRLSYAYLALGRHAECDFHLQRTLALATEIGERSQADAHYDLARLRLRQGRPDQAINHAHRSLALYRTVSHLRGQGEALNALGWYHTHLGNLIQAVDCCEQALALLEKIGDHSGQANTWHSLGYAHHRLGHHHLAIDCYQHALALYEDLGHRYHTADTLCNIGDNHYAAGDTEAARAVWTDALLILSELDHPDAVGVRAKLRAADQPR